MVDVVFTFQHMFFITSTQTTLHSSSTVYVHSRKQISFNTFNQNDARTLRSFSGTACVDFTGDKGFWRQRGAQVGLSVKSQTAGKIKF